LLSTNKDPKDVSSYYFSGLSFSVSPITGKNEAISELPQISNNQTLVSLRILEKVGGVWQECEQAKLPKIAHGNTEDSVVINDLTVNSIQINKSFKATASGDITLTSDDNTKSSGSITAESINAKTITQDGNPVPTISLVESTDSQGNSCWQLQFSRIL
jgi:hypothetical protein